MSKYGRHQSIINRTSDESIGEDNWLKQLAKTLEKSAVQPKSVDSSMFDQINTIMNGKSRYPSVAAAVEDMKERSGLKAYLDKVSADTTVKKAGDDNNAFIKKVPAKDISPVIFQKCPKIKNTFENYVRENKGNLVVPAIIAKIKSIHQNDVSDAKDWDDDDLIKYVSNLNLKAKADNPDLGMNENNLGTHDDMNESEIDPSNNDAFYALTPVKF